MDLKLEIMNAVELWVMAVFGCVILCGVFLYERKRKKQKQARQEELKRHERERQEREHQEELKRQERERQERERQERERQERLKEEAMSRMREQKAREEEERIKSKYTKAKIFFQGIWVTHQQLQFLANHAEVSCMRGEKLRDFLINLGKTNSLFADFTQEAEARRKEKDEAQRNSYNQTKQNQGYRTTSANTGQAQSANVNSFYQMFGLTPVTLTSESLKQAYRELVKKYHPDKNKEPDAAEKFQRIQRCYEYLQKELRRKAA